MTLMPLLDVMRIIQVFAEEAREVSSPQQLFSLIEAAIREFDLDFFAVVNRASFALPSISQISNCPLVWTERIVGDGRFVQDPVLHTRLDTHTGFKRAEVPRRRKLTHWQRNIFGNAKREGFGEGYSIPANIPGKANGSGSVAARRGNFLTHAEPHTLLNGDKTAMLR